ncbi:hypothetical protein EDD18DRAFT_1465049 [Armillaria luteobubalina]|uniref:PUB domain-containing protein n=1 Tax=Armillaria luteobubalina TaxID=153913 RepID=A0AA39Q1R3_9AGAR|nr:hypothetical protein EDD18DRAFT_1465049 [Armillaria luteobubalina]
MSKVNLQLQEAVLQAAQRRSEGRSPALSPVTRDDPSFTNFDKGYQMRNELRRMIDVGILGMVNNHEASKEGVASLKTLLELANNIIDNPEKEKFQRFKMNNPKIKKVIIEPKGVLQFAIQMGFRQKKTVDMEEYRVFVPKYRDDLALCASLLKTAIEREQLRADEKLRLAREKEEKEEQWATAMKRFLDDRKKREENDMRERDARQSSNVVSPDSGSNDGHDTVPGIKGSPIEVRSIVLDDDQDDRRSEVDVRDADGLGTECGAPSTDRDTLRISD